MTEKGLKSGAAVAELVNYGEESVRAADDGSQGGDAVKGLDRRGRGFALTVLLATSWQPARAGDDPSAPPRGLPTLPRATATPKAEAGDDQRAIVGHEITLNGGRSEPKGSIGLRWFQLGGPQPVALIQDGYVVTLTPKATGVYRFGLVVAAGSVISELDTVDVTVELAPTQSTAPAATMTVPTSIESLTSQALRTVEEGPTSAEGLAAAFQSVAGRMDLYPTYADVFAELSRRLEAVVPVEPTRRAVWVQRLFNPLTNRLVEAMRVEGLDLGRPEGQAAALTAGQKAKLVASFEAVAAGARAVR